MKLGSRWKKHRAASEDERHGREYKESALEALTGRNIAE
jgi:hypothetical protein